MKATRLKNWKFYSLTSVLHVHVKIYKITFYIMKAIATVKPAQSGQPVQLNKYVFQ